MNMEETYFIGRVRLLRGKPEKRCLYYHYRDESYNGYSLMHPESYYTYTYFKIKPVDTYPSRNRAIEIYNLNTDMCKKEKFSIYSIREEETISSDEICTTSIIITKVDINERTKNKR